MFHLLDLVCDEVEVDVELGADPVLDRDLDGVLLLVGHGGQLQGRVHDARDPEVEETFRGDGAARGEVQLLRELAGVGLVVLLAATVAAAHPATNYVAAGPGARTPPPGMLLFLMNV